jgi:hypothetical protein
MDISRYMNLPKISADDVKYFAQDFNKESADMWAKKKALKDKFIAQCPYKVGDCVMIKHRKYGWKKAKIHHIDMNTFTGTYEYMFKHKKKKIPQGHVVDMVMV